MVRLAQVKNRTLFFRVCQGNFLQGGRETNSDKKGDLEFGLKGGCELDFCVARVGDLFKCDSLPSLLSVFFRA